MEGTAQPAVLQPAKGEVGAAVERMRAEAHVGRHPSSRPVAAALGWASEALAVTSADAAAAAPVL